MMWVYAVTTAALTNYAVTTAAPGQLEPNILGQ